MHDQSMNQLSKVNNYTGCVSANTRPPQLCWGDQDMGTAISCTKCSQVAVLIQKIGRSSSKAPSLCAAVFHSQVILN